MNRRKFLKTSVVGALSLAVPFSFKSVEDDLEARILRGERIRDEKFSISRTINIGNGRADIERCDFNRKRDFGNWFYLPPNFQRNQNISFCRFM